MALLLSDLKPPTSSDLSRKRKLVKNPPVGKKRANSNLQSNLKTIQPQQRVNECSKEPFTLASEKLFFQGCHEELPLKKSSTEYHISIMMERKGYKKGKLMTWILHSP